MAMDTTCLHFLDGLHHPSFIVDPSGSLVFANPCWCSLLGVSSPDPWMWLLRLAEEDRERAQRTLESALDERRATEIEFSARRTDGSLCTLYVALSPWFDGEEFLGLVGLGWDVTERRRQEDRLAFMAGHDPLTGLANRRAFEETLERAVARAGRGGSSVLLLLDLDRLKAYNDARGHLQGDQALVNFAMTLRASVRASDTPARIGGDEFAVLLEDAPFEEALEIAGRLRDAAATEFVPGARDADLGVSGGLAQVEGGVDRRVIMDRADAALYAAKQQGRHRMVAWETGLGGLALSDRLATRIREALAQGGFSLVFQPVVRLSDGSVAYYESLVRLHATDGEVLAPPEFLGAVERLGLMSELTRNVLDMALVALQANPGSQVSVNLSAVDLTDPLLLHDVEAALDRSGIEPGRMVFEIAEDTMLGNLVAGRSWMERLSVRGCRFVLDDFGTGLGVFVLLRDPFVEQVKLSHAVIGAMSHSKETRSFVEAVRELIESQGKTAVAAFLETEELLADVKAAGFSYGQGFCVRTPGDDLARLISELASAESANR